MSQLAPLRATFLQSYTTCPICCFLYSLPCILTKLLIHDSRKGQTKSQSRRIIPQSTSIYSRINGLFQKGVGLTLWLEKPQEDTLSQIAD